MNCSRGAVEVEEGGELVARFETERVAQMREKNALAASAEQPVAVVLLYIHHDLKLLPEAGYRSRFPAERAGPLAAVEQPYIRP